VGVVDLHRYGPQVGQHLVNQSKRYIGLVGRHFDLTLDVPQEPIDQLRSLDARPSAVREGSGITRGHAVDYTSESVRGGQFLTSSAYLTKAEQNLFYSRGTLSSAFGRNFNRSMQHIG
jgi:hypothetical protein